MINSISARELRRYQDEGKSHVLLDVRGPKRRQNRIQSALSVPVNELEKYATKLPKDQPVILYDQDKKGEYSSQAVLKLQELGFPNVMKLEGGVEEWAASTYPMESIREHQRISFESIARLATKPIVSTEIQIPDLS